jgi:predicted metal-dependent hydrolase
MPKPSRAPQLELPLAHARRDSTTDAYDNQLTFAFGLSSTEYQVRRSAGRSIRVCLEDGMLAVHAPNGTRRPAVEAALGKRRQGATALPLPSLPREWREDARVPFLGNTLRIKLVATSDIRIVGDMLELPQPPHAGAVQIRDCVHAWLQREAQIVLGLIVAACNPASRWSLLHSRTDLHFVDASGELRLNWRLVLISRAEIVRIVARACRSSNESHAKNLQADLLGTDHS